MDNQTEHYDHQLYKHCEEKEADAIAWAFVNKDKMVRFPFQFPELKPNEARANVLYAGICLSDVMHSRGHWSPADYPTAPGHEIIAQVCMTGSQVTSLQIGDVVGFGSQREVCGRCRYCLIDKENLCDGVSNKWTYGGGTWGGFATHIQHPADHFFKLPPEFDLQKGSSLFCAGATVFSPIEKHLKEGARTAVIGIGGLGHLAVQFLAKLGHEVAAVTSKLEKKDKILSLGATEVIDMNSDCELFQNEQRFDFVISTLPTPSKFNQLVKLVAPAGCYVQLGDGPFKECFMTFSCADVVRNEICIVGGSVASRNTINKMLALCIEKCIYPIVEEFSFEDFPRAFEKVEKREALFRCVVNVGDFSKRNGLFKEKID